MVITLSGLVILGVLCLLVWLRDSRYRLKALRDIAMAVSDLNDRLARIEAKLGNRDQKP
jgi:uncharacterized membrane protein YqjE